MTSETKGKGIQYSHTTTDDKHYFAGFLNLAQNNIDNVFSSFASYLGLSSKHSGNIELLKKCFADNISDPDFDQRISYLQSHFPVISHLTYTHSDTADRRSHFRENFELLIKSINQLRDFYTHYYHKPITMDEQLYSLLDSLFLSVIQEVRKNKMKNDQTRHLLKKSLHKQLTELQKLKKAQYEKDRTNGKQRSLDDESIENAVFNDAFYHLLYKKSEVNRRYKSKPQNEVSGIKTPLSESGLLFLVGLFLNKKESEDFRSRIKGYKADVIKDPQIPITRDNNSLKFSATHWVFNHLAFKGLKDRLNTGFSRETLLIQIADELSKVPDEVYTTFTLEQRNQFVEDINEYIKEGENTQTMEDAKVVQPVIRKRYENKFHYFVLRYLDEFANLPTLRFQIKLGFYVHDKRTKNIEGTAYHSERVIKEKINVFGRLAHVTNLKTDFINKNSEDIIGWDPYPNPSYNFVGNNIPIFVNLQKSKVDGAGKLFGQIEKNRAELNKENEDHKRRGDDKATKKQITSLIDPDIEISKFKEVFIGEPTAIFSLNELPALLYEFLVKGKSGQDIEDTLINKLIERYQTLANFKPGHKLPTSQITKNLLNSKPEPEPNYDKLINAIDTEISTTEDKILLLKKNGQELNEKKNGHPVRKFIFTKKELGEEATWLANDLKRFMPKSSRMKWRGHHHRQLQKSLALFDLKPGEAFDLLKEFWNFDDDNIPWNPFIRKALANSPSFEHLYDNYLKKRKSFFVNIYDQAKGFKDNKKQFCKFFEQQHLGNLFFRRLYTIDTTENQIKKLLAKPLVFPRGIFDDKPTYIKGKSPDDRPELYADWYRYTFANHELQRFYSYPRDYKELFALCKEHDIERARNKHDLSEDQYFELFKRKQDKKIKQVKAQDIFLKLILEDILRKVFGSGQELSLKDFYLTPQERAEKERKARLESENKPGAKPQNTIKDTFIWSLTVPFEEKGIKEPAVKLKDLGKFKRLLTDKKAEVIFTYSDYEWPKIELEQELELLPTSYEVIRREEIFKELQNLERYILQKWGFNGNNHPAELEENGNPRFKKYITCGILRNSDAVPEEEIKWLNRMNQEDFEKDATRELESKTVLTQKAFLLVLLRNKFAHNQLPKKAYYELIKKITTRENPSYQMESYSMLFLKFIKDTTPALTSVLDKT